jgi:hypothetical protein
LDKEIPEEKLSNPKISLDFVGLGFDKKVLRKIIGEWFSMVSRGI